MNQKHLGQTLIGLIRQRAQTLLLIALGLLLALVVAGYFFEWTWTGFSKKTLFDWLQILVFPAAVAIGTFVLNRTAKRRDEAAEKARTEREEAIQEQHAQDAALEAYLTYMSRLLTDRERPLHRSQPRDNLSVVARAQTLTVLGRLDGKRKGSVLRFLYEAGLIDKTHPVLRLSGADLREANLRDANLREAFLLGTLLSKADLGDAALGGANLHRADLSKADLSRAQLIDADLRDTLLNWADLSEADLSRADLCRARLGETDLNGADLRGADLSGANLIASTSGAELLAIWREAGLTKNGMSEADLLESLLGKALSEADLSEADLSEADLRAYRAVGDVKNLTQEQIDQAKGNEYTVLPEYLHPPLSWSKSTSKRPNGEP